MSETNSSLTYATFKLLSVLNEPESRKANRPVYDDHEVCEVRFSGNKQTVGVFPAHEQTEWVEDPITQERTRITYAQKYNEQYKRFKSGEAQAASGTPLEELTFLTQGKRLELKALNIYTAEALSDLDGNNLKMLGVGGRELKTKAQAYLDNASNGVDVTKLSAENEALKKRLAELEGKDKPASTKKTGGKDKPKDDAKPAPDTAAADDAGDADNSAVSSDNPFADWEAEDIKLWLEDAEPGIDINADWGKVELAEKAKEINDKIAAAKSGA